MRVARVFLLTLAGVAPWIVSCGGGGGSTTSTPPLNPEVLNGNWILTNDNGQSSSTSFIVALGFIGNQGYAYGGYTVACPSGSPIGGFLLPLSGTVAPDGSFQLVTPAQYLPSVVISGQVPSSAGARWSGKYSFNGGSMPLLTCSTAVTSAFVAQSYPEIMGKYTGTVTSTSSFQSLQVTLQVSQGAFGPTPQISIYPCSLAYSYPVNATLTVTGGKACFASGATNATTPGVVSGGVFVTHMKMDDGSVFTINGFFPDSGAQSMVLQVINTGGGGSCGAVILNGTLSGQG